MSEKIVIIDYGRGNLYSVANAIAAVGGEALVTSDRGEIAAAQKIILPGVGAFGDCMENLRASGLIPEILRALREGKPFLGICLGMQLLFEGSDEAPGVEGLGFFPGRVHYLKTKEKIPHMGWNKLALRSPSPLLAKNEAEGAYMYFVHSFHCVPADAGLITSVCDYGMEITASVGRDNVQAVQFHPEKSSRAGLELLRAFKEWRV